MNSFTPAKSQKLEINTIEQQVLVPGNGTLRVFSDRTFHIAVDAEVGEPTVGTNSMPIAAMQEHYIAGTNAETLVSFVVVDGETDGSIWLTTGARG